MLAFEGFEDDVAEKRNTKEKELGHSLCYLLVSQCKRHLEKTMEAYIFMAVHAKTFQLHNTSIFVSLHQVARLLEGRLADIVRLSVSGHDKLCVCLVGVEYVTDFGDAQEGKK